MFMNRLNRDNQLRVADLSFALMGGFGFLGVIMDAFDTNPIIPNAPDPILTGLGVSALMILVGFVIAHVAMLDRKRSEEYAYQTMASGAVVSVITTLVILVLWTTDFLLERWLGAPSPSQIIALLLGSWAIGYFTYRIKGIHE